MIIDQRYEIEQKAFESELKTEDITNLRRGGGRRSGGRGGGDARAAGIFLGPIMILIAIPMAWFNEQTNVKMHKL